ncbi:helix-turn-helix domain-containing protein [Vicingaceae bacterium]|nr:helix-turn-helix domain-containing protein [Vicingaceae bacterium]
MQATELITIKDLQEFENRITIKLENLSLNIRNESKPFAPNYLRSKGAKELLKVSDNKLRSMRESGELSYSFIGSTYYFLEEDILNILKENTINKK